MKNIIDTIKQSAQERKILKIIYRGKDGLSDGWRYVEPYSFSHDDGDGNVQGEYPSYAPEDQKIYDSAYDLIEELDEDLSKLNIDIGNIQDNLKKSAYRRKCDFDVEITRDALNAVDDYDTLLLFSGDGDYFALTEDLIKKGKKVILVFAEGHKGKEYNKIENSLFYACSVDNLENCIKKQIQG